MLHLSAQYCLYAPSIVFEQEYSLRLQRVGVATAYQLGDWTLSCAAHAGIQLQRCKWAASGPVEMSQLSMSKSVCYEAEVKKVCTDSLAFRLRESRFLDSGAESLWVTADCLLQKYLCRKSCHVIDVVSEDQRASVALNIAHTRTTDLSFM
jgi:hypothetical protein